MNIFEYIDKKRNEYENLRDESQLQLKANQNRIQQISSQIQQITEKEEEPGRVFLPEAAGNYEKEIGELQEKIDAFELQNDLFMEQIRLCEEELRVLDELELPELESDAGKQPWRPMVVSAEEFQEKNVSRETSAEVLSETVQENSDNAAEETKMQRIKEKIRFCRQISLLDPQRCSFVLDELLDLLR